MDIQMYIFHLTAMFLKYLEEVFHNGMVYETYLVWRPNTGFDSTVNTVAQLLSPKQTYRRS